MIKELKKMTNTVKIKGMSCNHCVNAVAKAMKEIQGVSNVNVDLDGGQATFDHDGSVDMQYVHEIIEKAGYEVG
jgi:copper chaperone